MGIYRRLGFAASALLILPIAETARLCAGGPVHLPAHPAQNLDLVVGDPGAAKQPAKKLRALSPPTTTTSDSESQVRNEDTEPVQPVEPDASAPSTQTTLTANEALVFTVDIDFNIYINVFNNGSSNDDVNYYNNDVNGGRTINR